jgi:hypothetical protein
MSINKTLAVLAASSALALFAVAPAYAEDPIVQEEQDQLNNSAQPDVDPGASKGYDAPIVTEERRQLNNSAQPDVPMGAGADTSGDPSIVDQEKEDLPH